MRTRTDTLRLSFLLVSVGFTHVTSRITPCVSGTCSHTGGDNVNSLTRTVSINGPQELIGDVTPEAGWNIQACDSNWSSGSHIVQMTCEGSPDQTQYCDHLFNGGAENTIVRLPENCGTGPFARVISITKTDTAQHTINLDYEFARIPPSRGNVSFQIALGNSVPPTTNTVLQPRFSESLNKTIPFAFKESVMMVNESVECILEGNDAELDFRINGTGAANGTLILGGKIAGTVVPPQVDEFQLTADITGNASLNLDFQVNLELSGSTGDKPMFSAGLPDLSIPGIFTLGPKLEVDTRADFDATLQTAGAVNVQWIIHHIHMVFPSNSSKSSRSIIPISYDPVHFSTPPSLTVGTNMSVTGHLIPKLSFGISVLDNVLTADVFVETDCSSTLSASTQGTFTKRDHPRDLMERGETIVSIEVDAAVDVNRGVEGELGPLWQDGDTIEFGQVQAVLLKRNFTLGNILHRREIKEAPRVFERDNDTHGITAKCLPSSAYSPLLIDWI